MARSKRKHEVRVDADARDEAMARLAAARIYATSVVESIDDALAFFVEPEEDATGRKRTQAINDALESAGAASRALEAASETMAVVDPEQCEPWDEEGDEDDDDDDQEED